MSDQSLDTGHASYMLRDGILVINYKPGLEITLDIAKDIVNDRMKLTEGKSYPGFLDGRGLKSLDKEAREYFSSEEGRKGVSAAALLVGSVYTAFLGNFFLTVTVGKVKIPTKIFTKEDKALQWLQQFK